MPEVIAKVIKVFEIIVEMLKTLKEKRNLRVFCC